VGLVESDVSFELVASNFWVEKNPRALRSVSSLLASCQRFSSLSDFFWPGGGGGTFLRNVGSYIPTRQAAFFIVTAVKTSNPTDLF
jgi:hypothetical protein